MKLIVLIVGLALGFGLGVYWGVHHPTDAAGLAKKEEEWYLKGKVEATQAVKDKLDQVLSRQPAAPATPAAGFLGGSPAPGGNATDALRQLRDEQQQQLRGMQTQLNGMGKK